MDFLKKCSQDVYVAIFLLIASVGLLINAKTKMSEEAAQFPVLILLLFIVLSVLLLFKGIQDTKGKEKLKGQIRWDEIKMPMLMFLLIAAYVVALDLIGFIIPSLVFSVIAMWLNFERNKFILVGVPVGLVAFLYVLFTYILQTRLP